MNYKQELKNSDGFIPLNYSGEKCGLFGSNQSDIDIISKNEWVWSAVEVVSSSFAKSEMKLYRNGREGKEEIKSHKALDILNSPNKAQDNYEFLKMCGLHLSIFGESIVHYDELAKTITPIFPTSIIEIRKDSKGFPSEYVYTSGMSQISVPAKNIIHTKEVNPLSFERGFSTFKTYRETAISDNFANEWNRKNFDGTNVDGVLSTDQILSSDVKEGIQKGWKKLFSWNKRKSDTAVLDGGMKYTKLGQTPKDMDFLNLTENAKQRILAVNKVPKALIGQGEDSNRASIWGIEYIFAKYTIEPKHIAFSKKFTHSFLKEWFSREDIFFEFKTIIPQDEESILEKQKAHFSMGALSQNEIREEEGREPIKNGDDTYIPFNLVKVGEEEVKEEPIKEEKTFKKKAFNKKDIKTMYLKRFDKNEKKLERDLISLFKKQEKETLKKVGTKSVSDYLPNQKVWEKAFYISLLPTVYGTAKSEGQEAIDEIGLGVDFFAEDKALKKAIETQTILFSKQVNETTIERLRKVLQDGVDVGEGEEELKNRVQEVFTVATDSRAKMIARTETLKASNTSHQTAYKQVGVEEKEWLAVEDSRTRPHHARADGQVVGIDEEFTVGSSKMERPGDISAPAKETVNCRCRIIAKI